MEETSVLWIAASSALLLQYGIEADRDAGNPAL
jgi:hypothetical protein